MTIHREMNDQYQYEGDKNRIESNQSIDRFLILE